MRAVASAGWSRLASERPWSRVSGAPGGADDRRARAGGGARDAVLECARPEPVAAVDGEREAGRAGQERPAREPGAGGDRHAGLDLRQALARLRCGGAEQPRPGKVMAGTGVSGHQQVWRSGDVAISWRSASSTSAALAPAARLRFANRTRTARVDLVRAGCRQNPTASSTSFVAPPAPAAPVPASAIAARNQRPRNVAVSSQRLSSQPATFGG